MTSYVKSFFIITLLLTLLSCNNKQQNKEINIWVNSFLSDSTAVMPQKSLLIQKGDTIKNYAWVKISNDIEGFDYIPGRLYKLKVKEEFISDKDPSTDASSKKYILLEILENKIDPKLQLNNMWQLAEISGKSIDFFNSNKGFTDLKPYLEINVNKSVAVGYDGCNKITGILGNIDNQNILFLKVIKTPLLCKNMELPELLKKGLKAVNKYKIIDGNLVLLYKDIELMKFIKVD